MILRTKRCVVGSHIRNRKEVCAPDRSVLRITRGGLSGTDRSGYLQMYVEDRDSLERLQEVARERRNTRAWTRLQAIVLAKQGDIAERIAHRLGCSRRAVPTWVAASNGGGVEALEERPHP